MRQHRRDRDRTDCCGDDPGDLDRVVVRGRGRRGAGSGCRGRLRGPDRAQGGRAFGIAADVTLGVGIAAAGTGALMLLLRDDPPEADAPSVTPAVASSALGTTMPAIEVSF